MSRLEEATAQIVDQFIYDDKDVLKGVTEFLREMGELIPFLIPSKKEN